MWFCILTIESPIISIIHDKDIASIRKENERDLRAFYYLAYSVMVVI